MSRPKVARKAVRPIAHAVQRISQIRQEYTTCRDLMHSWKPVDARIDRRNQEILRIMKCTRCPMQRTQILNMDGTINRSHYSGPVDYYLTGGRMTASERAALRLRNANVS